MSRTETPSADIQVITRSADILRLISARRNALKVATVAEELGMSRTTAHRYLNSLVTSGFLVRDPDGNFALGPLLVQLGTTAVNDQRVVELAESLMRELSSRTQETIVLSLWGGNNPVVARVYEPPERPVRISMLVGTQLDLNTAQGRVFLAYMRDEARLERLLAHYPIHERGRLQQNVEQVTGRGYATTADVVQGIRGIAAPVFDTRGDVCATLAVLGTVNGMPAEPPRGLLLALLQGGADLSRQLGFDRPYPATDLQSTEWADSEHGN